MVEILHMTLSNEFMVPRNGHQGGTVCRFVAMYDKHTAT